MKLLMVTFAVAMTLMSCSDSGGSKQPMIAVAKQSTIKLDNSMITVSGISSGGYMASQYHIAFSKQVTGAALLSSGPYGCANGDLKTALASCMNNSETLNIEPLFKRLLSSQEAGEIDSLESLSSDKVWVFHGELDQTVSRNVINAQQALYQRLSVETKQKFNIRAGHGFPTLAQGISCGETQSPFINQCDVDIASEFLSYLYPLASHKTSAKEKLDGELIEFDQSLFLSEGDDNTLADKGYLFVPSSCLSGVRCQMHIAFHGCQQNVDTIGQSFIRDTEINQWASANNLVVLYPQTKSTYLPLNPKACWDWWGYTGSDYLTKAGAQLKHINNMVNRIEEVFSQE